MGSEAQRRRVRSFLVGGPVRDLYLGITSPDIDVAVESRTRQIGEAVARLLGARFVYHERFMTGTLLLSDSSHIDITQTRTDSYHRAAVLPRVKPAGIEADLVRRDFTINAAALELTPDAFGRLIDPHGGVADIRRRTVRILHDQSFRDDPTRIFRCVRFAVRLGFEIEPVTLRLLRQAVGLGYPALLTPERILYELRMICAEPLVLPMVEALLREKVLQHTWRWRAPRSLLGRFSRLVQGRASPEQLFTYWLSVLPVTDRFPISAEERASTQWISGFDRIRSRLARVRRPSSIHRLLRGVPSPALHVLALIEKRPVAARIRSYLETLSHVRSAVSGNDIRAMGIEPGPQYRRILDELLAARLDNRVATREQELALCRRLVRRTHRTP